MTLYTLSGIAGSGKTERLIAHAIQRLAQHRKTAFVCHSKQLCRQTHQRLIDAGISVAKITMICSSNRREASVGLRLQDHLKHARTDLGEILICTHAAFFACAHWHRRDLWCPLIDEVPQVHADLSRRLYQNFAILTGLLAPDDLSQPYTMVGAKDAAAEALLRSRVDTARSDEVNELHRDLLLAVLDPNREVWCDSANWLKVTAGIDPADTAETREERGKLRLYGLLKPSFFDGFDQPVIAAACVEDHLFHALWQRQGADVRPAVHITSRYGDCSAARHDGSRLVLRLLCGADATRSWSKTFADAPLSDGRTPRQSIRDFCEQELAGRTYAFVTNANPDRDDIPSGAILLGPHCHGLNHLRHIKTIVISSALMPDRRYQAFLRGLGVSDEAIHRDIAWITAYQGMMRTALRDAGGGQVVCYIADPCAAAYIAGLFPGCSVEHVPCFAAAVAQQKRGPKPKELTAEQQRERRNARDRLRYAARKRAVGQEVATSGAEMIDCVDDEDRPFAQWERGYAPVQNAGDIGARAVDYLLTEQIGGAGTQDNASRAGTAQRHALASPCSRAQHHARYPVSGPPPSPL